MNDPNTTITDLASNDPHARYIFGLNEPDHSGSYCAPEDAAVRWANMEIIAEARLSTLHMSVTAVGSAVLG